MSDVLKQSSDRGLNPPLNFAPPPCQILPLNPENQTPLDGPIFRKFTHFCLSST